MTARERGDKTPASLHCTAQLVILFVYNWKKQNQNNAKKSVKKKRQTQTTSVMDAELTLRLFFFVFFLPHRAVNGPIRVHLHWLVTGATKEWKQQWLSQTTRDTYQLTHTTCTWTCILLLRPRKQWKHIASVAHSSSRGYLSWLPAHSWPLWAGVGQGINTAAKLSNHPYTSTDLRPTETRWGACWLCFWWWGPWWLPPRWRRSKLRRSMWATEPPSRTDTASNTDIPQPRSTMENTVVSLNIHLHCN